MALINCPECGKEVSDKATACIHCGYPIAELTKKQDIIPAAEPVIDNSQTEIEKNNKLGDDLRVGKQYPAALDAYIKAAELGSAHAQLWIGNFYNRGLGVVKNQAEATKWYQKAAAQGSPSALCNLAGAYQDGIGVVKDIDKAIELYLLAIQKGVVTAAGNLGCLYEHTADEHQSYHLAIKYYEQAISMGTTDGNVYNNLALLYQNGYGTSPNYFKAEKYFIKAIELGNETAKKNYGVFANNRGVAYAFGNGVERDYSKAEEYYLKAIEYGNEQAKKDYPSLKKLWTQSRMVSPSHSTQDSNTIPHTPSYSQKTNTGCSAVGLIIAAFAILIILLIGIVGGGDDDRGERTCAWCGGTGYSANGAESVEDYVFKKTPCTHCGGDGKY